MSTLINFWTTWAYFFRDWPFGEYVAAFVMVGLVVFAFKRIKAMVRYV